MKHQLLPLMMLLASGSTYGQMASDTYLLYQPTDRTMFFSTSAEGVKLPILWGLDTAWPSEENIRRGVRFIGAENIGIARVSFQPWDFLSSPSLTTRLEDNLKERLRLVSLIGGPDKVKLTLNNDAPGDVYDTRYANSASDPVALKAYCDLIYATTLSCQDKGWTVVGASPLNEPDYIWNNQGSKDDFLAIAKKLKTDYPGYNDGKIRICGGNTLNNDSALVWYRYLYDYIDEGNTHQLAGSFDTYADFFAAVKADGKMATGDELHNVGDAIVGAEYGMTTGIWWGTAEYARGQFCRATSGERLAYVENRPAWGAAAVYRATDGKVQAFFGCSERQASPCDYRIVSTDRDVFFDGHGPQREYVVAMPGGKGYADADQKNAECVVNITWGEDISPVVDGTYMLMNANSRKVLSVDGAFQNLAPIEQQASNGGDAQLWTVEPVPNTIGGDFSYYTIKLAKDPNMKLDVLNWSLEDKGGIILYNGSLGANEQWLLRYMGDGFFQILSRHSGLCLELSATGDEIYQAEPGSSDRQLWRLLPPGASCDFEAPSAPSDLKAKANSASVSLEWSAPKQDEAVTYTVLRAEAGSDEYNTVGRYIEGTKFLDNTADPTKGYSYKVKAVDRSYNQSASCEPVGVSPSGSRALIAHLPFDGSLVDISENGFDALYSSPDFSFGKGHTDSAQGLRVLADKFVQLPYRIANCGEEMTLAMWIYRSADKDKQQIFNFSRDGEHYVSLTPEDGGLMTYTVVDGENVAKLQGPKLTVKQWHHVAVAASPAGTTIYLDGEAVGSGSSATPAEIAPVLNYIGRTADGVEERLLTMIQDLRVYNYALNASEVKDAMNGQTQGVSNVSLGESPVIAVEYYTIAGQQVAEPTEGGVYIVRKVRADGTSKIEKEVVRI